MDLLPGHPARTEYRRCLLKVGESTGNFSSELEYGISETEGSSLLDDEEPSLEIKRSYMDWCIEHNIEYIEACASNAVFDKCKTSCIHILNISSSSYYPCIVPCIYSQYC